MSTRSTIFLTGDHNEHCFEDCSEPLEAKDGRPADAITIEFSKANIRVDLNDDDDLIITITNPDSELYKIFQDLI